LHTVSSTIFCLPSLLMLVLLVFKFRLHDRLQDCPGGERLQIEAGAKVQKFIEWALQCIHLHRCSEDTECYKANCSTHQEVQFHLSAFKAFLDIAGDNLSGKIFTEAFDAACFPLTLFSTLFEPGWSSGSSAVAIQGLLSLLVEGGAENVNQCFLEASRFGSTELVRILLKVIAIVCIVFGDLKT
jgi:hypothetical protein